LSCRVIHNDGAPDNYVLLTGLKNIFQKQLPKMPREYITRLIYDPSHQSLLITKPGVAVEIDDEEEWARIPEAVRVALSTTIVGGITYKPFTDRGFVEIVFCAVSSTEQVKGYGAFLMNHMKEQAKREGPNVQHFLTYADNYAVGYFQKQGFSKEITLDRTIWAGYIKDYDGGTLMQCTMVPGIDYMSVYETLHRQKLALLRLIDAKTGCSKVFPGLRPGQLPKNPLGIPGVREAGWNEQLAAAAEEWSARQAAQDHKTRLYQVLKPLLSDLTHHPASWPFRKPVDPNEVPDYPTVITMPMDLATMAKRLESEHYKSIADFTADVRLVCENCRTYNDPDTVYYKNANILEKFYADKLKARELK
jgi:histone acetyltransferase